ncbi:hypothetical protein GGR57DRAFT_16705 [Xylariaceae sp. FL1272]|nr:hypothetical protein GGR57DRAFT_16705 [Xylariaceae sp. FL1272]
MGYCSDDIPTTNTEFVTRIDVHISSFPVSISFTPFRLLTFERVHHFSLLSFHTPFLSFRIKLIPVPTCTFPVIVWTFLRGILDDNIASYRRHLACGQPLPVCAKLTYKCCACVASHCVPSVLALDQDRQRILYTSLPQSK